jgi:hypothetical protein
MSALVMALVANSKVLLIDFGQCDPHALRVSHSRHEKIRRKSDDARAVAFKIPREAHEAS